MDSQNSNDTLTLNDPNNSGNTITVGGTEYASTMAIDMSDLSSYGASVSSVMGNYSTSSYGNITISNGGSSGSGLIYGSGAGGYSWSNITANNAQSSLQVTGEANFDGDVTIKGISITKTLEDINKRLAILVPDPDKLEHFEALKKAYNHYKMLEALCELPKDLNDS